MIDSVLKGTGNSRFLKSAVPAGTSWADALAMLQAGTFPIDFNGINTEGFRQVGTPLNKANLLKDATALTLGLTGDAVPNDMFNALAHAGDLHVWRKTVTNQQAGYNLGEPTKNYITSGNTTSAAVVSFSISDSVSVDDLGNVAQDSASTSGPYTIEDRFVSLLQGRFRGKFVKATNAAGYDSNNVVNDGIWYIPVDAIVSCVSNGTSLGYPYNYCFVIDKMQAVSGHGAETTVTYPVSTDRNAYQEGNDAKPAGYTLGEVVTGRFMLEGYFNSSHPTYYIADTKPTVTDDGIVSVNDVYGFDGYNGDKQQLQTLIRGKYIKCRVDGYTSSDFRNLGVVYIPEDTVVLQNSSVDGTYIDRYQPVTGYAAIPAGTTIEYLGCLGDKARAQVVSYVGTGTYGADNPNSLTFDFPPKVVMFLRGYEKGSTQFGHLTVSHSDDNKVVTPESLATTYTRYNGFGGPFGSYAKKSEDGKTIFWYNEQPGTQGNNTGYTYYFLAIG